MSLSRYRREIWFGSQVLGDVVRGLEEAKADDGKVDAGEVVSILLTALFGGLMGLVGAPDAPPSRPEDE